MTSSMHQAQHELTIGQSLCPHLWQMGQQENEGHGTETTMYGSFAGGGCKVQWCPLTAWYRVYFGASLSGSSHWWWNWNHWSRWAWSNRSQMNFLTWKAGSLLPIRIVLRTLFHVENYFQKLFMSQLVPVLKNYYGLKSRQWRSKLND
jgi:hypothetical protein